MFPYQLSTAILENFEHTKVKSYVTIAKEFRGVLSLSTQQTNIKVEIDKKRRNSLPSIELQVLKKNKKFHKN